MSGRRASSLHEHEQRLSLANTGECSICFVLEPWGETYEMPANATFDLHAQGPDGYGLEVAVDSDHLTVWAWPGSTVQLYCDGVELGNLPHTRPAVPRDDSAV